MPWVPFSFRLQDKENAEEVRDACICMEYMITSMCKKRRRAYPWKMISTLSDELVWIVTSAYKNCNEQHPPVVRLLEKN